MDEGYVYEKLNRIFMDVFDDESIQIAPELTADDVADWDSMAHIRSVTTVENAFHVKFSAAEIGTLRNVGELVRLIRSKQ